MSDIFEQMLKQHTIAGDNDRKNALYEVMQQVVLSGLYRGGFFKEAAFYGGTCLRILHGLKRYSEDMDFSYKGAENITCEYQGEPMEIGFNSRFLREMVENLDVDTIQMSFSKPQRAALITPMAQHDENEDVLMLIMPVMLN